MGAGDLQPERDKSIAVSYAKVLPKMMKRENARPLGGGRAFFVFFPVDCLALARSNHQINLLCRNVSSDEGSETKWHLKVMIDVSYSKSQRSRHSRSFINGDLGYINGG